MDKEILEFDLTNNEKKAELQNRTMTSEFFTPEPNKPYKIKITSPKIKEVEKEFEGNIITKYQIEIEAESKDGEKFKGIWETGKKITKTIATNYKDKDTLFRLTREGTGINTSYNFVPDF